MPNPFAKSKSDSTEWKAMTVTQLGDKRELSICTMQGIDGRLRTIASVHTRHGDQSPSYVLNEDYMEVLAQSSPEECSRFLVISQHQKVLKNLIDIEQRARDYYAVQLINGNL